VAATYAVTKGATAIPVYAGRYREGSTNVNRVPQATIDALDADGIIGGLLTIGSDVTIQRNGATVFPGIVKRRIRTTANDQRGVRALLVHEGYQALQRWPCDAYVYDEDGLALTTRDAVKVNPWKYQIFRKAGGTLTTDGLPPALDGARVEDVVRCLIGTRLIVQHDLQDNTPFLPSDVYVSTNKVQVYVDGATSDIRPKLQRVRKDATSFLAGQAIESIPLENGDPNVKAMGAISTVAVVIIGELTGSQHPTLRVCRNARAGTRTYTSVTLTHTANYLGSGLSAWTGSVDLSSDGAAATTSLGYEITIPGSDGDAATTKVHYVTLKATTVGDIGISEGTISTYNDPHGGSDETEWVEDDYMGMTRGDALERLRKGTVTDSSVNPNPNWDMWVDGSLNFHFTQRRGSNLTTATYSHANENISLLEREDYADRLGYQVIGVGGGRGQAELLLVDRSAYASGGLYDATRDPDSGALYGDLPQVLVFRDQSITSMPELRRRARAYFSLYRDPRAYYRIRFLSFQSESFGVGDSVQVDEPDWGLSGELLRVQDLERSWDGGGGEDLNVQLGEKVPEPTTSLGLQRQERERADSRAAAVTATSGVGGPGVYFDKDHYGRFAFGIPEGVEVDRVLLKMTTLPWQGTTRSAAAAASGDTVEEHQVIAEPAESYNVYNMPQYIDVVADEPEGTYGGGTATGTIRNAVGNTTVVNLRLVRRPNAATAYNDAVNDASGNARDLTNPSGDSPRGTFALVWGNGFDLEGAANDYLQGAHAGLRAEGDFSAVIVVRPDTVSANQVLLVDEILGTPASSPKTAYGLGITSAGKIRYYHTGTSGSNYSVDSTLGLSAGTLYRIWVRRNNTAKTIKVVVNGTTYIDTTYAESPQAIAAESRAMQIGKNCATTLTALTGNLDGHVFHARVWTSLKSEAVLTSITDPNDAAFSTYYYKREGTEAGLYFLERMVLGMQVLAEEEDTSIADGAASSISASYDEDEVAVNDTLEFQYSGDVLGSLSSIDTLAYEALVVIARQKHTHPMTFGIYQFDGDSGDGTGNPIHAKDVRFAVDPNVNAQGIPTAFSTDAHPLRFGEQGTPREASVDVTGYLRTQANGVIAPGEHAVYFLGAAAASNAQGLSVVSVTPILRVREAQGA
jgi:hypothetical protein